MVPKVVPQKVVSTAQSISSDNLKPTNIASEATEQSRRSLKSSRISALRRSTSTICHPFRQLPTAFSSVRHVESIEGWDNEAFCDNWRMRDRMKTVSVALVMCLHVGVDPPDIMKPNPCARLQCWIDPYAISQQKALEMIGINLQKQYERWQPRARYKLSLDPTVEDVKKLCISLRRNAKDERVLFHYNGHGVPKPTRNGEVWVFNKSYTQYIPLSVFDLQNWMGAPSIYVYDCSNAAIIVESFNQFAEQHERDFIDYQRQQSDPSVTPFSPGVSTTITNNSASNVSVGDVTGSPPLHSELLVGPPPNFKDCIQLAACQADEILPLNPELPADLFTSCLTTPVKAALMWYLLKNNLCDKIDLIDKIPGQLNDRRTMLGELNWIFTAVTDTIAWNTLPKDLFQKLFRQDLLVASLFRNFLLADRVMRSYQCTPVSSPALPESHEHPLWAAWDFALDICLSRLQEYVNSSVSQEYEHTPFFASQLTAFQVWLEFGHELRTPPQQLPMVLQVLLSVVHRTRALELLGKFLDLGSWAVSLALSVGIFPYVLKLLQSSARELRPLLAFVWTKLLAVDTSCQNDLVKDNGHRYFMQILSDSTATLRDKTLSAFILASILDNYELGQNEIMNSGGFMSTCAELLVDPSITSANMRKWLAIALGRFWCNFDVARWQSIRLTAYEKVYELLSDYVPEVRAAAVYSLGTLLRNASEHNEHIIHVFNNIAMTLVGRVLHDGSPLVRKELVIALHWFVLDSEHQFVNIAAELNEEEIRRQLDSVEALRRDRWMSLSNIGSGCLSSVLHRRQTSLTGEPSNIPESPTPSVPISLSSHYLSLTQLGIKRSNSARSLINAKLSSSPQISHLPVASTQPGLHNHTSPSMTAFQNVMQSTYHLSQLTRASLFRRDSIEARFGSISILSSPLMGGFGNVYANVWKSFLLLLSDPFPEVSGLAKMVVEHINERAVTFVKEKLEAEQIQQIAEQSFSECSDSEIWPTEGDANNNTANVIRSTSSCSVSVNKQSQPLFVIGSPPITATQSTNEASNKALMMIKQPSVQQLSSSPETPSAAASVAALSLLHDTVKLSPHSVLLGRQRRIFDRGPANPDNTDSVCEATVKMAPRQPLIRTNFVDWCRKRFAEPILNGLDSNDLSMPEEYINGWVVQAWKNMSEISERDKNQLQTSNSRLETQLFIGKNGHMPNDILFHPLLPILLVAEQRTVSIWNWETGFQVTHVSNLNQPDMCRLSSLVLLNPLTRNHLLTCTDTGDVRVWETDFAQDLQFNQYSGIEYSPRLVTAWNALGDLERIGTYPKTVLDWEQETGILSAAGDVRVVRLWDVQREQCLQDIPLGSDCTVNCVSADSQTHYLIVAGCSDGTVRLFDRRLPTNECRVMTLRDMRSALVGVCLKKSSQKLIAAASNGNIRIWEPRMFADPVMASKIAVSEHQLQSHAVVGDLHDINVPSSAKASVESGGAFSSSSSMPHLIQNQHFVTAMDVHQASGIELIAVGTSGHLVHALDFSGKSVGIVKYHDGLINQRIAEVLRVALHPYRACMAIAGGDAVIAAYGLTR